MKKRTFQLTPHEQGALRRQIDGSKNGPLRTRYQALLMYAKGYPVAEILDLHGCSRAGLMKWCHAYRQGGFERLKDHRNGGNNARLNPEQKERLGIKLQEYTPEMLFGQASGPFWNIANLVRVLEEDYGVRYQSRTSYQLLLTACGFSYQKTEKVFKSRRPQQVAEFEEQLEKN